MKVLISLALITASFIASAEPLVNTEKLINSGDPAQVTLGYQRCGALMIFMGNAAVKTNPEEGAGYITIGHMYSKLYRNSVDLRTEAKRNEAEISSTEKIKMYAKMVLSDTSTNRSFLKKDFDFCQKWADDL